MPYYPLVDQALRNQFVRQGQEQEIKKRFDPWDPGQRGRQAVNDWMLQNVAMPMYERGYPQVGAYLTGIANTATDLALPETNEDAAALPFGAFKKGGKLMSNAVDLLTPEARQQALKRQNAIQAVREAIQKNEAKKKAVADVKKAAAAAGIKDDWPEVQAAQKQAGFLGMGKDLGAYDADGVVVKSPKFNEFHKDFYDNRDKRLNLMTHERAMVQRLPEDEARNVAEKDLAKELRRRKEDMIERFIKDQDLEYADLAPETFMVNTRQAPYLVQEKAPSTLANDLKTGTINQAKADQILEKMQADVQERTALYPIDLRAPNVANYGNYVLKPDYRIIDSGEFTGVPIDEAIEEANQSWRFIDWLKSKK